MESARPSANEGTISVHNFSEKILEQVVHFHVMKMKDGFFLWIGASSVLSNLAVAMCSKYDSVPLATLVFGDSSDTSPSSLAQRLNVIVIHSLAYAFSINTNSEAYMLISVLISYTFSFYVLAKKTKKQVFVSYNLPSTEANLTLLVEDRIKKEMELFPDKF
ncbi:PSMG4 protein, partial [Atractosteus spatula]|nr:PSMG4 protein [Atractosteus spatula]